MSQSSQYKWSSSLKLTFDAEPTVYDQDIGNEGQGRVVALESLVARNFRCHYCGLDLADMHVLVEHNALHHPEITGFGPQSVSISSLADTPSPSSTSGSSPSSSSSPPSSSSSSFSPFSVTAFISPGSLNSSTSISHAPAFPAFPSYQEDEFPLLDYGLRTELAQNDGFAFTAAGEDMLLDPSDMSSFPGESEVVQTGWAVEAVVEIPDLRSDQEENWEMEEPSEPSERWSMHDVFAPEEHALETAAAASRTSSPSPWLLPLTAASMSFAPRVPTRGSGNTSLPSSGSTPVAPLPNATPSASTWSTAYNPGAAYETPASYSVPSPSTYLSPPSALSVATTTSARLSSSPSLTPYPSAAANSTYSPSTSTSTSTAAASSYMTSSSSSSSFAAPPAYMPSLRPSSYIPPETAFEVVRPSSSSTAFYVSGVSPTHTSLSSPAPLMSYSSSVAISANPQMPTFTPHISFANPHTSYASSPSSSTSHPLSAAADTTHSTYPRRDFRYAPTSAMSSSRTPGAPQQQWHVYHHHFPHSNAAASHGTGTPQHPRPVSEYEASLTPQAQDVHARMPSEQWRLPFEQSPIHHDQLLKMEKYADDRKRPDRTMKRPE